MKNETSEIDLLDLVFFLKKKSINIILSMVAMLLLAIVFLWVKKDQVNINYQIKINSDSPSMIVNCESDFSCKSNFIESLIKESNDGFDIQSDEKTKTINLVWHGNTAEKSVADAAMSAIHQKINAWYIDDYQTYKRIIDDSKNNEMNGTELYTKIALITRIDYSKDQSFIFYSKGVVSKKYKESVFLILSLVIGFILSCSYLLIRRAVAEYNKETA